LTVPGRTFKLLQSNDFGSPGLIGKTLAHYEITGLLGKGGMGEVYRARDTKLERDVALKVLPAAMAADPARLERFEREAKTVAGLNHPHIVTLYSVEEADGVRFLTMELVEGQGLDQVVTADGLELSRVFDIGIAVADALAAAHEKGIVHRDLKPANVMIAKDGRAKVLDFGLAKLAEPEVQPEGVTGSLALTGEGSILGTVPYMSPEQLRGAQVDHRSDIFALGILLYELATGRRPFGGATNADVSSSILKQTPPVVTQLKPDLPRHLGRIVTHCLEKDPERRSQSAKDIRNELEGLRDEVRLSAVSETSGSGISTPEPSGAHAKAGGRGKGLWMGLGAAAVVVVALVVILGRGDEALQQDATTAPKPNSIAVLAFVNMSADPEQEYFSDGIAEELLNLLAKIPQLRVTSRSSAFSFKGKDIEVPEIARRLNVAHILEGSVRKAGNQVRITAQLIEAGSDTHLWSETYDRTLDDIFAIQDDIASDVVEQLKVTLLGEAPQVRETDPQVYALYLQARHLGDLGTPEGYEKAIELCQQALAIDPDYLAAWDELASVYINQAARGGRPTDEGFRLAREAANKALAIDPDFALAHASLGWIAMAYDGDLAAAARHLERALALEPRNTDIINNATSLALSLGRLDESIALDEYLVGRDPVKPGRHFNLGFDYISAGRWDEAIASFRTALTLSPGMTGAQSLLGRALLGKGDSQAALEAMQQESFEVSRLIGEVIAHHALGQKAESDAALDELIEKYEKDAACDIAYVLAYRNEADRAFEWLDKAVEYNDPGLAGIVTEPLFANVHSDSRWQPFLESIGKSPEQLAAIEFNVTLPQ
jgi:TolB-like protein/Flp pilus assembly protein TadD